MQTSELEVVGPNSHPPRNAPSAIPDEWLPLFQRLTGDSTADDWGLRAAIVIARYRKKHGSGPTFGELFTALGLRSMPDLSDEEASDAKTRIRAVYLFRQHTAVHWRRLRWIQWDRRCRSLSVNQRFRDASRAHNSRSH